MAKQIKAIKCPQCGSTQKTEIKPDHYRCDSCGTEYFLDDNDININYNYRYQTPPPAPVQSNKKLIRFILVAFCVFIVIALLISFFSGTGNNTYSTAAGTSGNYVKTINNEEKFSLWHSALTLFTRNTGQPVIALIAQRNYYNSTARNGFYISFYDAQQQKELGSQLLQTTGTNSPMSDVNARTFANGDLYFAINKTKLYKVDKAALTATDVTASLFKTQADLQTGIATVEFMYSTYGDGLTLLTNDGKNYTYYPLTDKLYSKEALYNAEFGFKTLLPNAVEKTYFLFTQKSFDYPDEKQQLLKVVYKDNVGGPKNMLNAPSWTKDYGGSGIFSGSDPYKKILVSKQSMEYARVLSYKDITPGRLYFEPDILFNDNDNLLILSKASAAPDAPLNLQSLDVNTGAVKWTTALNDVKPSKAIAFTNGFVLIDYTTVIIINTSGTIVNQYKLN